LNRKDAGSVKRSRLDEGVRERTIAPGNWSWAVQDGNEDLQGLQGNAVTGMNWRMSRNGDAARSRHTLTGPLDHKKKKKSWTEPQGRKRMDMEKTMVRE